MEPLDRSRRASLVAVFAGPMLLATGCIVLPVVPHTPSGSTHRGAAADADFDSLTIGITSREDVLLTLGEPDLRGKGDRTMGWVWDEAWLFWAVGSYGGAAAGELTRHLALMVAFDESGRLERKAIVNQPELASDAAWFARLRTWP